MIHWMIYLLLVSAILSGVALTAEAALRRLRLPTRGAWLFAIAGSIGLPFVLPVLRSATATMATAGRAEPVLPSAGSIGIVAMEPVSMIAAAADAAALDPYLLAGWVLATAVTLSFLVLSGLRLWLRRRSWTETSLDGTPVLLSSDTGPAVVGLLRGSIVLPRWALSLEGRDRALLLKHEREHQRAGDVPLLNLGLAVVAACPWNPCLWWALRRLRLAVEVDCDARVLRSDPDRAAYGGLLLRVGGRSIGSRGFAAAAAVESGSTLEHRIRIMTASRPRRGWLAVVPLSALAAGLLLVACEVPEPTRSLTPSDQSAPAVSEAEPAMEPAAWPPSEDARLMIEQQRMLRELLEAAFQADSDQSAPAVSEAEPAMEPAAWLTIEDPQRSIEQQRVIRELLLELMEATGPADKTAVVQTLRERIEVRDRSLGRIDAGTTDPDQQQRAERRRSDISTQPAFTPRTVDPRLDSEQRAVLMRFLERNYPPELRDAGISGRVVLWAFIDERGTVRNSRVVEPSGHPEFDNVAQQALRSVTFSPARNRDEIVAVWVQLPIMYHVRTE